MFRIFVLRTTLASTLLSIALATSAARAEETFECEDGGLVTVLPGQLELMKRTDPCVARHFQQSLDAPRFPDSELYPDTDSDPVVQPAPIVSSLAPADAPLPAKKPEAYIAGFGPLGEGYRSAEAGDGETVGQAAATEVKSDFRNVHIINGGSGPAKFYQHTR